MPQNYQNYIAGAWCDGDATIENINPSDLTDSIGHYAQASRRQLNDALDAAASAQKQWAKTGLEARQTILMNIGNELMARREELGQLLSREEGKPLAEGMGEIYRAGQFFTYYAAETLRQIGDTADSVGLASKLMCAVNPLVLWQLSARGIFPQQPLSGKLPRPWLLATR